MDNNKDETYIDFGAGEIPLAAQLLAKGHPEARVIAFERQFLRSPKQHNLLNGVSGDDLNIPLGSDSVDRIFATFIRAEMPDDRYIKLLQEFYRILKRNSKGYVLLCETQNSAPDIMQMAVNIGFVHYETYSGVFPPGSDWGETFAGASIINPRFTPTVVAFVKR